jgi:hypothetical protein
MAVGSLVTAYVQEKTNESTLTATRGRKKHTELKYKTA